MNRSLGFVLLSFGVALVGCQKGDKPQYANVSGKVTFNGQPVEKGQITFSSEGRPPFTMDIVDGKFNGQAMVGSNKVSVSAKRKSANAPQLKQDAKNQIKGYMERMKGEFGQPPADYDPSLVEYIPPEWNTASKQTRVVEAGAPNDFQFDIKGAKN
jgi:hypothetical protein